MIERLRLRDGALLKRAAALLFHPSPHRFLIDLLYTKYTRGLISYDGIYRVETFPVSRAAMREAVGNAVVHRDYAKQTSTQIGVYHDRITIRNPAELQRLDQSLDQRLAQKLAEILDQYLSQTASWPSWKRSRQSDASTRRVRSSRV